MKQYKQTKYYKTEGIVLKGMPLGDRDRIVSLYTQDYGRLRLVARGVRKVSSKISGHLDTFNRVGITLSSGNTMGVITGGEVIESFNGLKNDLKTTARAFYLAELIDDFVVDESPNKLLYSLGIATLRALDSLSQLLSKAEKIDATEWDLELIMRCFEIKLLICSGYSPELRICVVCNKPLIEESNGYSVGLGGIVGAACSLKTKSIRPISVPAIKTLRFLSETKIENLNRLRTSPALMDETQGFLQSFVQNIIERKVSASHLIDSINLMSQGKK